MTSGKLFARRTSLLLLSVFAGAGLMCAGDDTSSATSDIEKLKAALAEQQKQLQALQATIEQQQKLLQQALTAPAAAIAAPAPPASLGTVASLTPVVPGPAASPVASTLPAFPAPQAAPPAGGNPCETPVGGEAPPYLRLGNVCITPIGFMDLTPYWRDKNAGSGMGSNFGSVPYNNTTNGNLSENHFSIQNSRLGLRVDGDWKGVHFIGYNEFDFNGTSGSSSLAVSNGAVVPRLRLFWVDARKDKWEFLAGQSWSMMTPNRKGISALPGDLFYSQVVDINYIAGLTWTRQPGMRILYHPSDKVTFGFSAEQPDQYLGGSGGGGTAVLPAALLALQGTQLDAGLNLGACSNNTAVTATAISYSCTGQTYLAQPGFAPDLIAKIAFDPTSRIHFEITGLESSFATTSVAAPFASHRTIGAGGEFNFNLEVIKNLRLISNNYWSDGGGRYLFGEAPDLVVQANGNLSALHAGGMNQGFEGIVKNFLLYGYYGADYIGRDTVLDANGTTLIGYGYKGSANSQNRTIQEVTFGFNHTIWRNPRYGAINWMLQYEWLNRDPWYVAPGAPKATHDSTIYGDIRYTLPGLAPIF